MQKGLPKDAHVQKSAFSHIQPLCAQRSTENPAEILNVNEDGLFGCNKQHYTDTITYECTNSRDQTKLHIYGNHVYRGVARKRISRGRGPEISGGGA